MINKIGALTDRDRDRAPVKIFFVELRTQYIIHSIELYIYFNIILLLNLVSMTSLCITSWTLNKGSSTADEQPPYDYNLKFRKFIISVIVI